MAVRDTFSHTYTHTRMHARIQAEEIRNFEKQSTSGGRDR